MKLKRIDYDDDIVIVKDTTGDIIYKDMEDYEPMTKKKIIMRAIKYMIEEDFYFDLRYLWKNTN